MQAINLHPFISHKIRTSLWSIVYVSATLTGIALLGITLNMLAGVPGQILAQSPMTRADSVVAELPRLSGKKKADTLLWLTRHYRFKDTKRSVEFARQGLTIGKALNTFRSVTPFYTELGIDMTILSEYAQARSYYDSSLTIALAVHDSITQATVFSNRAIVFTYEEHYDKAIESYLKALNLYEISRNDDGMMRTYSNIAWVYSNINNIEQAGKYYRLAYDYAVKLNDKPSRYTILGNLASNLEQHGRLSEAKKLNHEVIAYYESTTPGSVQVGNIYFNVSKIHAAELDWDSSYYYAAKALELFKMREATKEIGYTYPILAEAELSLGKIKLAEQHALEGRRMNGELGTKTVLLRNLFTLVKIYRQQNNVPESRKYEDEFWMLSDSLDRENQAQAVLELQTKYETEEKTRENELLIKESELKDAKLAGGQYIVLSALLGLCLMGSLAFVLYQKNQHRGRLNQTLQTENEKLKVEMLVAQLNQLKDQINPHFLFNSLATLQSMAQEQDPNTGTFVQKLSEVYRYILQTNSDSLVSLKEELGVAEAYLFMLKARFEGALFISVKISDSLLSRKLPPSHYSC